MKIATCRPIENAVRRSAWLLVAVAAVALAAVQPAAARQLGADTSADADLSHDSPERGRLVAAGLVNGRPVAGRHS